MKHRIALALSATERMLISVKNMTEKFKKLRESNKQGVTK
jgi:hypothetical protein